MGVKCSTWNNSLVLTLERWIKGELPGGKVRAAGPTQPTTGRFYPPKNLFPRALFHVEHYKNPININFKRQAATTIPL